MASALLIKADARSLPLADESVGLVLADPPWNIGLKRARWPDSLPHKKYMTLIRAFMAEAFRVAKPQALFYCFCQDDPGKTWLFKATALHVGWAYRQILYWHAPNFGASGNNPPRHPWIPQVETILLFAKGARMPMLNILRGINTTNMLIYPRPQTNFGGSNRKQHPCQKPVELWSAIIARSPGDPVLDIFCGAAGSAIAAVKQERNWIGVDLDYFDVSRERIRQTAIKFTAPAAEQNKMFVRG